jgi:hypothetical protein
MSTSPTQHNVGQYQLTLVPHTYRGSVIQQRATDGYINATAMCRAADKLWSNYAQNDTAKGFLAALERSLGIPRDGVRPRLRGWPPIRLRNEFGLPSPTSKKEGYFMAKVSPFHSSRQGTTVHHNDNKCMHRGQQHRELQPQERDRRAPAVQPLPRSLASRARGAESDFPPRPF